MLAEWVFIALLLPIGLILPTVAILANWVLGPKKPNEQKSSTYECGIETVGDTWVQFKVQYYIFALIFVIFAVEAVFLFPWAVAFGQLSLFGVVMGLLFLLVLVEGLLYAWRKGALEWV
jgi:NADH:ubiquinone oxidoreductase subunit 3 (subunit A)